MIRARLTAIGRSDQLKRKLLAAQQANLLVAHQIDTLWTDARDRPRGDQGSPDFAPVLLGNADSFHGSSSGKGRLRLRLECTENNGRRQPVPQPSRTTDEKQARKGGR